MSPSATMARKMMAATAQIAPTRAPLPAEDVGDPCKAASARVAMAVEAVASGSEDPEALIKSDAEDEEEPLALDDDEALTSAVPREEL